MAAIRPHRRRGSGRRVVRLALPALLLSLFAAPVPAGAQAYRYLDDERRVHFTDNLPTVPGAYRDRVETVELPARRGEAPESSRAPSGFVAEVAARSPELAARAQLLEDWFGRWGVALVSVALLSGLVTLGSVLHALTGRRPLWAAANLLLPVVPIYLLRHLDEVQLPVRVGLALLWLSPLLVGALAFRAALPAVLG